MVIRSDRVVVFADDALDIARSFVRRRSSGGIGVRPIDGFTEIVERLSVGVQTLRTTPRAEQPMRGFRVIVPRAVLMSEHVDELLEAACIERDDRISDLHMSRTALRQELRPIDHFLDEGMRERVGPFRDRVATPDEALSL